MIKRISEYEYYMEIEDLLYNQGQKAVLMFVAEKDPATQSLLKKLYKHKTQIKVPVYVLDVIEADTVAEQFCGDIDEDIPDILLFNVDKDHQGDFSDRFAYPKTSIKAMVEIVLSLKKED